MKETAYKYFSVVLTWVLFLNFICVSFSFPVNDTLLERTSTEFTQAAFYFSSAVSEQSQKKENNKRFNSSVVFCYSSGGALLIITGYASFVKNLNLSHIHFNYFLISHFSTST